jgi:sortase A
LYLKIPKIKIDSNIVDVGLASDGTMEMTKSLGDVGWYRLGQHPGEVGSAVIAGHYGWDNGVAAVFNDLSKLRAGDTLSVEDAKGVTTTFIVRESKSYDPKSDASRVFSSNDGKSHLNLVTCDGVWNEASASYSKRLVVFADKQ